MTDRASILYRNHYGIGVEALMNTSKLADKYRVPFHARTQANVVHGWSAEGSYLGQFKNAKEAAKAGAKVARRYGTWTIL